MSTVINAMSIGGERGGSIRDNATVEPQIKRYRELQAKGRRRCFIRPAPSRPAMPGCRSMAVDAAVWP